MPKRNGFFGGFFDDVPLFFKLWFGFVFTFAVLLIIGVVVTISTLLTNPTAIGEFFGQIVAGFNNSAGA